MPTVDHFKKIAQKYKNEEKIGRIHFLSSNEQVFTVSGRIVDVLKKGDKGEFLLLDSEDEVSLGSIITLFGQPGPAIEKYAGLASSGLTCNLCCN